LGVTFAGLSGLALGIFFHAIGEAGINENGLSPYGILLLMAGGLFAASIVVVPFFLYFPVKGAALQVRHYFKGTIKHHILGVIGGIILACSILAGRIAAIAPTALQGGAVQSYLLGHSAPVVAVLLGLLVWHEFTGANTRVRAMLAASMVLLIGGMAVLALAPTYGK
jgi:glucose uptake protein